ncbi:MAG: SseB family protein [Erysipelotrichaceae bacterium]
MATLNQKATNEKLESVLKLMNGAKKDSDKYNDNFDEFAQVLLYNTKFLVPVLVLSNNKEYETGSEVDLDLETSFAVPRDGAGNFLVYTSETEIEKANRGGMLPTMLMSFGDLAAQILSEEDVVGFVINEATDKYSFNKESIWDVLFKRNAPVMSLLFNEEINFADKSEPEFKLIELNKDNITLIENIKLELIKISSLEEAYLNGTNSDQSAQFMIKLDCGMEGYQSVIDQLSKILENNRPNFDICLVIFQKGNDLSERMRNSLLPFYIRPKIAPKIYN